MLGKTKWIGSQTIQMHAKQRHQSQTYNSSHDSSSLGISLRSKKSLHVSVKNKGANTWTAAPAEMKQGRRGGRALLESPRLKWPTWGQGLQAVWRDHWEWFHTPLNKTWESRIDKGCSTVEQTGRCEGGLWKVWRLRGYQGGETETKKQWGRGSAGGHTGRQAETNLQCLLPRKSAPVRPRQRTSKCTTDNLETEFLASHEGWGEAKETQWPDQAFTLCPRNQHSACQVPGSSPDLKETVTG